MPVTIRVNGTSLSLVHKFSTGISIATIPDVCKTPSPGGPVPVPYPNIAQSITLASGTTTVKTDKAMAANKGSKFALSNGDNAGVAGGVKSSTFMKEATWILYSFDVKMDGKNAARLTDKMFHNAENAANLGGVAQQPLIDGLDGDQALADKLCEAACKAMEKREKADKKAKSKAKTNKKKQKPSTKKFQNEMRNELDPRRGGSRGKKNPGLLTEVGQAGDDLIGKYGSEVAKGREFVKWDIVITKSGVTPAPKSLAVKDVKHFVEVKFPKDTLTKNQQNLLKKMPKSQREKVVKMTVGTDPNAKPPPDCLCT
jgi:hypothetical protein